MQVTISTGNGSQEFDPDQWLSEDRTKCTSIAKSKSFFAFGKGNRSCLGQSLSIIELVTYLAVLAREVKSIQISEEEMERDFLGLHPTGMPLTLIPNSQDSAV